MNTQLMTHLYYGDPNEEFSLQLAKTLTNNGADILEIGIPYSDPVCDGEVFQKACLRALEAGTTPQKVFTGIKRLRELGIKNQIYITSYYGPVFKMGNEEFMKQVAEVGAQGVIIPDILLEEQDELLNLASKYNISVIQFATPYSTDERLKKIISVAKGFIYCISTPGVTGAREKMDQQILELILGVKTLIKQQNKNLQVFVGFGISKPDHVEKMIQGGADGVIIGSAIGKIYSGGLDNLPKAIADVGLFIRSLGIESKA